MPNLGGGFYSFEKPDWFSIKGFVGDTTVEVRFKPRSMDMTGDFLFFLFSSYHEDGVDLTVLKRREQSLAERVRIHLYGKGGVRENFFRWFLGVLHHLFFCSAVTPVSDIFLQLWAESLSNCFLGVRPELKMPDLRGLILL